MHFNCEYKGQSPGDLDNLKNGFAGRFSGYDKTLKGPQDKKASYVPVILLVSDSILSSVCVTQIRILFKGKANVSFLQQPHHCKNIGSWLDEWEVDKWDHYHSIFWFDGMHGFPTRVTKEEHQKLTPVLMKRILKNTQNILWGNCTPIPDGIPQDGIRCPRYSQIQSDESVINRNLSIHKSVSLMNIQLLDLYSITKPLQQQIQQPKDVHFNSKGDRIIANSIFNKLNELYF
jgi:hypothetical protein